MVYWGDRLQSIAELSRDPICQREAGRCELQMVIFLDDETRLNQLFNGAQAGLHPTTVPQVSEVTPILVSNGRK